MRFSPGRLGATLKAMNVASSTAAQRAEIGGANIPAQAGWFFLHAIFAVASWAVMMAVITLFHPPYIPVAITLAASFVVPLIAGTLIAQVRGGRYARYTWIAGVLWLMIIGLWILDMPTSPGACLHCTAGQKLWLTFFSFSEDSGMIDGQGRFLGTWPAAAMIGYSIGARLSLRGGSARA
ncbi:hypothetical protein [Silvibacterium acidisoli]|uniref:hypothetical protein n=1 Tax=Acidobacteriaceae bacterium ZG23-2 TaxID=2883246 RepID=UPI00406BE98B